MSTWQDKPNSEGWWWYKEAGKIVDMYYIDERHIGIKAYAYAYDDKQFYPGKWQKAIVPNIEE